MHKRIMSFFLVLLITVAFLPAEASAASGKVKMTGYNKVLKSGNVVYCAGAEGIYRVGVDTAGKVTGIKLLYWDESSGEYSYFYGMKLKGKYLYAQYETEGTPYGLCRVHVVTGKCKELASVDCEGSVEYAIKGNKIYYKALGSKKGRVMNLNGKSKKRTSVRPKMTHKKSNADGYTVIMAEHEIPCQDEEADEQYLVTTYLKTPAGTFKLGSHIY